MITKPKKPEDLRWYHRIAMIFSFRSSLPAFTFGWISGALVGAGVRTLIQHKVSPSVSIIIFMLVMNIVFNVRVTDTFNSTLLDYFSIIPAVVFFVGLIQHNVFYYAIPMIFMTVMFFTSNGMMMIIYLFGKPVAED